MKLFSQASSYATLFLSCVMALSSCSNDTQESAQSSLESEPIFVTEVEFAAARYIFEFVTKSGHLVTITPTLGSGTAAPAQGIMSITGTNISASVEVSYETTGIFFATPEEIQAAEDAGIELFNGARGIMTVNFTEPTGDSVNFFKELGVTRIGEAPGEGEEETEEALPVNSSFIIYLDYFNYEGSDYLARVESVAPLSMTLASWVSSQGVERKNIELESWLEGEFLQGAFRIQRNQ